MKFYIIIIKVGIITLRIIIITHGLSCVQYTSSMVIVKTNHSFTDVRVWFYAENYNVTEGDAVNVTLVTNTSDYEFDFTVTLLFSDASATGESCSLT